MDLKLVMNRRINNELLTTYLPTVFILVIVYATNYFKPFFFEAVVTVNLTSQLVLTTLFIRSYCYKPHFIIIYYLSASLSPSLQQRMLR